MTKGNNSFNLFAHAISYCSTHKQIHNLKNALNSLPNQIHFYWLSSLYNSFLNGFLMLTHSYTSCQGES